MPLLLPARRRSRRVVGAAHGAAAALFFVPDSMCSSIPSGSFQDEVAEEGGAAGVDCGASGGG
jgi:hypothetical protein